MNKYHLSSFTWKTYVVGALCNSGTASQAKQPLLLLTPIHDQHEHARVRIKFPTCCRGPFPSLPPHSPSADSVWPCTCWHVPISGPVKKESKRTPEFWATQGLAKPNGRGKWNSSSQPSHQHPLFYQDKPGLIRSWRNTFPHGHLLPSHSPPQKLTPISKQWRSDHSQGRADLPF